jgi:hypothetical protein
MYVMSMPCNFLKKKKTMEYYQKSERKAALNRVQRIVNQNVKNVSAIRENELACSSSQAGRIWHKQSETPRCVTRAASEQVHTRGATPKQILIR